MFERRGRPTSWKEWLNYNLDNLLSRAPVYQLFGLLAFAMLSIFLGALGYVIAGGIFRDYPTYAIWHAILKIFDPGTMAVDTVPAPPGSAYSVPIRIVSVFLSMAGIFLLGMLISILTTSSETKLRELRKGRTRVFERDHTIILGWSNKIFTIIQEIIFSNDFCEPEIVVILAELEKEVMEDEIKERFPKLPKWLKIICRTGYSIVPEDLNRLNIPRAKAVILVADENHSSNMNHGDARAVKTLLAVSHNPFLQEMEKMMPVVAEIEKREVLDAANLAAQGNALFVLRPEIVSKIMVQTARQSGLSGIYSELLSFDGNELYVHPAENFVGKPFGDTLFYFEGQIPIGIVCANETVLVNPEKNRTIEANDSIIVISETEKIKENSKGKRPEPSAGVKPCNLDARKPEKLLILGWNREIFHIIREFDMYVLEDSYIRVVADIDPRVFDEQLHEFLAARSLQQLENCSIEYRQGDRSKRSKLEKQALSTFESIILLSDWHEGESYEVADARTIMSLLIIRDILKKTDSEDNCRIVSEILDPKNQKITEVTLVNDIIISNELISQILTQVSRQPEMLDIYDALFAEEGSEIYFKRINLFKPELGQATFRELMASALVRDEIAIGYKHIPSDGDINKMKLVLNPENIDVPISLHPDDRLVVLAENEAE